VAATLDDQAQLVFSSKVDCGDDIVGLSGGHCIDAWLGCPCADPAGCLRQRGMIPNVVGISQCLEHFGARRAVRCLAAGAQGRIDLDQSPFNRVAELVPALLGRPSGIARPYAGENWFVVAVVGPGGRELPQFRARKQGDCGRLPQIIQTKLSDEKIFEELVLATLSRFPTDEEKNAFREYRLSFSSKEPRTENAGVRGKAKTPKKNSENRQALFVDTMWALINTREFILNH
jgi:hypothetical protein